MAENNEEVSTGNIIGAIFWSIFVIIWIICSIIGFIMSLICLSYNGTTGSKVAGVLLSIFFGPFYWFYYIFRTTYCTKDYIYPQ